MPIKKNLKKNWIGIYIKLKEAWAFAQVFFFCTQKAINIFLSRSVWNIPILTY